MSNILFNCINNKKSEQCKFSKKDVSVFLDEFKCVLILRCEVYIIRRMYFLSIFGFVIATTKIHQNVASIKNCC